MSYTLPQVSVHAEASIIPTTVLEPMRACVIGGNAQLFRYDVASEKASIALGAYDPTQDVDYSYPGRPAGGIVDQSYVKLYADDVLLRYHLDADGGGYGVVAPVAGYANRIRSDTVA